MIKIKTANVTTLQNGSLFFAFSSTVRLNRHHRFCEMFCFQHLPINHKDTLTSPHKVFAVRGARSVTYMQVFCSPRAMLHLSMHLGIHIYIDIKYHYSTEKLYSSPEKLSLHFMNLPRNCYNVINVRTALSQIMDVFSWY